MNPDDHYHDQLRALLCEHPTVDALIADLKWRDVWEAVQADYAKEGQQAEPELRRWFHMSNIIDDLIDYSPAALHKAYGPTIAARLNQGQRQTVEDIQSAFARY